MSTVLSKTFTTPGSYTYDADLLEVTAGVGRLKDLVAALGDGNAMCGNTFTTDEDLNWSPGGGSLTGTLAGSAAVAGGLLDMSNASADSCSWNPTNNLTFTQTGTIRIKFIPRYTGGPAANQTLFYCNNSTGNKNRIWIQHYATQHINIQTKDSAGTNKHNVSFGTHAAVSGTAIELEINFDVTTGSLRCFVDGVQLGAEDTTTFTRTTEIDTMLTGHTSGANTEFDLVETLYFSTVQHIAGYTPDETIPETLYSTADPTMLVNDIFTASDLEEFLSSISKAGSDEIKFTLVEGGQDRYWTGAAWANSDGTYAQANTTAEIETNKATAITTRNNYQIRIFFHSDDGTTRPSIDSITITYNADLGDATLPTIIDLEGFLHGPEAARSGIDIKMRPYLAWAVVSGIHIQYEWITVDTTDANGHWEGKVYVNPVGKFWEIKIGKQTYTIDVSGQTGLVDISSLTMTPVQAA